MFKTKALIFCCYLSLIFSLMFPFVTKAMDDDVLLNTEKNMTKVLNESDEDGWGKDLLLANTTDRQSDNTDSLDFQKKIGNQRIQNLLEETTNLVPQETPIEAVGMGAFASFIGACCGSAGGSLAMKFFDSVGINKERLPPDSAGAIFLAIVMALGPATVGLSTTYKTVSSSQIWRPTYLYGILASNPWGCPKITSVDVLTVFGGLVYASIFTSIMVDIESNVHFLGASPRVWQGVFGSIIFIATIWRYLSLMSSVDVISHEMIPASLYKPEDEKKQAIVSMVDAADKSLRNGEDLTQLAQSLKVLEKELPKIESSQDESLSHYGSMEVTKPGFGYITAFKEMGLLQNRFSPSSWDSFSSEAAKWGSTSMEIFEIPMKVFSCRYFLDHFLQFCKVSSVPSGWTSVVLTGIPGFIPIIGSSLQVRKVIAREIRQFLHGYESERWICQKGDGFREGGINIFGRYVLPWAVRVYTIPYSWQLTAGGAARLILADLNLNGYSGCATAIAVPLFCFAQSFIAQYFEDEFTDVLSWFVSGAPNPCFNKILSCVDKKKIRENNLKLLDRLRSLSKELLSFNREDAGTLHGELKESGFFAKST